MADIGIIMMNSRAGDTIEMIVQRKKEENEGTEAIKLTVELSDLSKPAGHP